MNTGIWLPLLVVAASSLPASALERRDDCQDSLMAYAVQIGRGISAGGPRRARPGLSIHSCVRCCLTLLCVVGVN
mgnify:CR=1 FL=1